MNKEFCFGIIPLKRKDNDWEVFLVKHNKGHWGFPKGHSLREETPEQIACREVFEETGLSVTKFLQVSPLTEKYIFQDENKTIDKSVTYFLAEVKGDVKLLNKEVCDSKWVSFDEALELLTFEQAKEVCIEAMKILNLPEEH
jgi:8-oxo-dGTP pyrophosphatase MutT (NUDIX family)